MFGKLINGEFQIAPKTIKIVIGNPTNKQYIENGYKPLVSDPVPEYDPESQYLQSKYTETETEIRQHYIVSQREEDYVE